MAREERLGVELFVMPQGLLDEPERHVHPSAPRALTHTHTYNAHTTLQAMALSGGACPHGIVRLTVFREQPSDDLARVLDEAVVVDLGQDEDAAHLKLHADAAEVFRELPHAPGHVRQLPLREQARMDVRAVGALIRLLRRRLDVLDEVGTIAASPLALQQLVDEARGVVI